MAKVKMNKQERLDFNDSCMAAAASCPQYHGQYDIEDRDILQGKISKKELLRHWWKCDLLWDLGYAQELDTDAVGIFLLYKPKQRNFIEDVVGDCF